MLPDDLVHAIDPSLFALEQLGITPDAWQARVLRSGAPRALWNCSRQSGKSTMAAVIALHRATYRPGSLILLVSPSLRQSSELFRKVTDLHDRLAIPPELTEDNRLSLTMANRSRIVSLPSKEGTVRGFSSVDLIIEDEASQVPDGLYKAIRPFLAVSGGRLILMFTPFGQRGHAFETWTEGGPVWERVRITAHDCPRISPAFLAEERAALGEWMYKQEYECVFADNAHQLFGTALIDATFSSSITPLFPQPAESDNWLSETVIPLFQEASA